MTHDQIRFQVQHRVELWRSRTFKVETASVISCNDATPPGVSPRGGWQQWKGGAFAMATLTASSSISLTFIHNLQHCTDRMTTNNRKRVCIVGAGASGMSAAYALSRHPERYEVTVFEKESCAGGMATSIGIDDRKFGADYINDGVQGCSPAFANTMRMFRMLGFEPTEVGMQYVLTISISITRFSNVDRI